MALASDSIFYRLMHKLMWWNAKRYLIKSVTDPELRAKLTPDYKFGCKRVVVPELPNFFLMLGPHSPIGNYSVVDISEVP